MERKGEAQHRGKRPALSEASPCDSLSGWLAGSDLMPDHQKRRERPDLLDAAFLASLEASPLDSSSGPLMGSSSKSHHQKSKGYLNAAFPASSEASPLDSSSGPLRGSSSKSHHQERKENSGISIREQKAQKKSKLSVIALLQAMESLANERNIDMSDPENAKEMTKLFQPVEDKMMRAQCRANNKNAAAASPNDSVSAPIPSSRSGKRKSGPVPPSKSVPPRGSSREGSSNISMSRGIIMNDNDVFSTQAQQEPLNLNQGLSGYGVLGMQNPFSMPSYFGGHVSFQGDVAISAPSLSASVPLPVSSRSVREGSSGERMMSDAMFSMYNPATNYFKSNSSGSGSGSFHPWDPPQTNYLSLLSDIGISPQGAVLQPQQEYQGPSQWFGNYNVNSSLPGSGTLQNPWPLNLFPGHSDDGGPTYFLGDVASHTPNTRIGFSENQALGQFQMGEPFSQGISQPPLDWLPPLPAGTSNPDIGASGQNSQPYPWEWYGHGYSSNPEERRFF